MVNYGAILSVVTSLPWFHPVNVLAEHLKALELMAEVLEVAVDESLPEARRRHPQPGPVPGSLLGTLVRDQARLIALSAAYEGQSLRAAPAPNNTVHLLTRDDLLRIRIRKMPDPEPLVPSPEQLELDLFPDGYAKVSLVGELPELGLFWEVRGEALYRLVLAAPAGWDDDADLRNWHGAAEVHIPAQRTLAWPLDDVSDGTGAYADEDDLDDQVQPKRRPEAGEEEAPGGA
jgi:hypothetical protein